MHKPSRWRRAVKRVAIELDLGRDEDVRANRTYAQGIVKYLKPSEATPDLTASVRAAVERLVELEDMSEADFLAWVKDTNPSWLRELAPSSPTAAVALPGQLSRRDRAAERIHYLAELYRHHGGPGAALVVLKRLLRAAFPEWLWEHLRRAWVYSRRLWRHVRRVRFYSGRIMDEFHVAGVRGVVDLFKRNFSRGR
jgi:hypothetical protein